MSQIDNIKFEELEADELQTLIARAHDEVERREKERFENIQDQIRELASSIGLTPEEVVMQMQRGKRGKPAAASSHKEVRYRNPANPRQTWTGRGKRPNWLLKELEGGASLSDFKVE